MLPELSDSGVPQSSSDLLAGLFTDAQTKLKEIVLHPPGKSANAQAFNQARASAQLAQIQSILAGLRKDASLWIGENLPIAMADGIRRAEKQAVEAGVRQGDKLTRGQGDKGKDLSVSLSPGLPVSVSLHGSFELIDHRTVSVFARDIYSDLSKATDAMAQRASKLLRETRQIGLAESDINRILAGGVIEGKPIQAIAQLRDELKKIHGNEVPIPTKNGGVINLDAGKYAELVVRTKTRQANTIARHERLEGLGLDLVSVVGRISKYFCTGYLGQVFSISGRSSDYPALSSLPGGGPPFHPNCSKSTRPFVAALASAAQLKQAGGWADGEKLQNVDAAEAQRRFKDLQIHTEVKAGYAHTAARLYGKAG